KFFYHAGGVDHVKTDLISDHPAAPASVRSRVGLNAANFFLAEVTCVVLPFLAKFLTDAGWRGDAIGVATALAGLGVFLTQTPAGYLVDRLPRPRSMLAAASVGVGACY